LRHGLGELADSSTLERSVEPDLRLGGNNSGALAPAARGSRRLELTQRCGAAACVFVPALAILLPRDGSLSTLALAMLFSVVWLIAIDIANSSAWFSPLVLGPRITSALGVVAATPAVIIVDYLFPGDSISSDELALATLAVVVSLIAFWDLANGAPKQRRVIVVGAGAGGAELVHELDSRPSLHFRCLGLVRQGSGNGVGHDPNGNGSVRVLGTVHDLTEIVLQHRPDIVVLAGIERDDAMVKLLDAFEANLRVMSLPDFYEHAFGRVPVEHVSPVWFMSMLDLYRRPYSRATKRLLDVVLAGCASLLCLPILPLIALAVRCSGPGPILFRQVRVGERGRLFEILKFRTMVQDAEEPGRPIWATQDDHRVTTVGRFLRKTRLDEIPQVWNVLRGDMSVVGPRPERPEFLSVLEDAVPHWTRRSLVKPGITGWAQVRVGYTSDTMTARDKLSHDLYYLKHRSLLLDLAIAAKTAAVIFSGAGSK
jgi:exopolysaccharide biosynthesis polyprenyl glycosylphosphotransferase